ncbi:cation:proton antiporter [Hellea sp.]|nr:cation:proton antiporter [Hellea sp.]
MTYLILLIFLLGVLLYALGSKRISHSVFSLPILFAALGFAVQGILPGEVNLEEHRSVILILAEITLVMVLFSDASRIKFDGLRDYIGLPARMLIIGMPLAIGAGTLLVYYVSPDVPWAAAILVAAILTPTDAALGQAVVTNENVPIRLRQTINIESGLNDGFAVPVVTIAAIFTAQFYGNLDMGEENLILFTLKQVTLGPLAGLLIGGGAAYLFNVAHERDWTERPLAGLVFVSTSLAAFAFAHLIGGNGLIAAFIAGLAFGFILKGENDELFTFMESEGQLLTIITFFIFGALLLPLAMDHINIKTVALAIGFLTLIRMIPIWISLIGTGLKLGEKLFLGWFGPRGLASILFAIIIIEEYDIPISDEILACVVLTVAMSIILHGVSSRPLSQMFKENKADE